MLCCVMLFGVFFCFVFVHCLVCPMLPVSLDCSFLIASSVSLDCSFLIASSVSLDCSFLTASSVFSNVYCI